MTRAIVCSVSGAPRVRDIVASAATLSLLVGGRLGWSRFAPGIVAYHLDEFAGAPANFLDRRTGAIFRGPVVFLGLDGADERSLTDEEIELVAAAILPVYDAAPVNARGGQS